MFYSIVTILVTAPTITGRDVKDLSMDFFFISYFFCTKISVSSYQNGLQLSCHLITSRYVEDLSPEKVLPHIV